MVKSRYINLIFDSWWYTYKVIYNQYRIGGSRLLKKLIKDLIMKGFYFRNGFKTLRGYVISLKHSKQTFITRFLMDLNLLIWIKWVRNLNGLENFLGRYPMLKKKSMPLMCIHCGNQYTIRTNIQLEGHKILSKSRSLDIFVILYENCFLVKLSWLTL